MKRLLASVAYDEKFQPLVFERADITVDRIDGERAILAKGPAPGTAVVTVGATELWGVEYGGIQED